MSKKQDLIKLALLGGEDKDVFLLNKIDEAKQELQADLEQKIEDVTPEIDDLVERVVVPDGEKGDDGEDYILTDQDKQDIADSITVPVVEKTIEKTEVIKETPFITKQIIDNTKTIIQKVEKDLPDNLVTIDNIEDTLRSLDTIPLSKGATAEFKRLFPTFPNPNAGGSGATFIKSMRDVNLTGLLDGNVLKYDVSERKWKPSTSANEIAVGESIIGGTANRVLYEDANNKLAESSNLTFDGDYLGVKAIDFDLTATLTHQEGRLHWDDDNGTLELGMKGGVVHMQMGQEVMLPRGKAIGSAITNGQVVYISGASGSKPTLSLAKADTSATSKGTIAMATEDILENANGYYTAFGMVNDIPVPTATFTDGDDLYLSASTAGGFTNVKPTGANHAVKIGYVILAHNTAGKVFVSINQRTNNFENILGMTPTYIPFADDYGFLTESSGFVFDEQLLLTQTADNKGLQINGYDNENDEYGKLYIDSGGKFNIDSKRHMYFRYGGNLMMYISSTGPAIADLVKFKYGGGEDFFMRFNDNVGFNNLEIFRTGLDKGLSIDLNGDVKLLADNQKLYFGATDDYSIEYTGSAILHEINSNPFIHNTGTNNLFFGENAGKVITGSGNVGIGVGALGVATSTDNSIAIGANALGKNTTGDRNVAIGEDALASNVEGQDSLAVGWSSLSSQIGTGQRQNTAVGRLSAQAVTTGIGNVSIGFQNMFAMTTGDNNVFVGRSNGYKLTTGSGNTGIGHWNLRHTNVLGDITNITDSVFIGRQCTALNGSGDTNEIVIGTTAAGYGSNTVSLGNSSITDTHLKGTVHTISGRIKGTTRVTTTYTILVTDDTVFANTDGGAYVVTLPAGVEGQTLRIINSGSSGNDVTLTPDGVELLTGANASRTMSDSSVIILTYNATDGWF